MGLTGLIAKGWLDEAAISVRDITHEIIQHPGNPLAARKVINYRAVGFNDRGRVAVKVKLFNPGMMRWTPTGAALVGPRHEALTDLTVWPLEPLPPGREGSITVEMDAMKDEARGAFTLKLWTGEAGDGSVVSLDGVTFP